MFCEIYNDIYISLYEQQEKAYFILWIFCLKQASLIWYHGRDKHENKKSIFDMVPLVGINMKTKNCMYMVCLHNYLLRTYLYSLMIVLIRRHLTSSQ